MGITRSAGIYTDEQVRDAIGTALVAGSNVTLTVDDASDTITIAAATSGASGIPATTVNAKGDLIAGTADDTVARLGVGTDGQVLTASSGATTGLAWTTPTITPSDGSVTNAKVASGAAINADKLADGTTNKVLTATERTKLSGVATGATANSTDATLLARANHTGTQAASTITGLATVATSGSASDLSTGTVGTARLGTGTASSTTYLRGDGTWATPSGGSSTGALTVINVKTDYGAAGNGSTNDTTPINNAIAACSSAGGGIVYFPPGTYMTDGGHSIPARVNILGAESSPQYWVYNNAASPTSACALKIRSGTAQTVMFTTSSSSLAFSIRNITLIGANIGTAIQGIAPVAPSAEQNSTIENVAVIGFTGNGIGGSWQAARFSTIFVGGCGGYGLNCSGSAQWADIMLDHSFITGNKLGALNIDSTGSNGLLNFTDTRFERSGWNPNAISTPTNAGSPGIRIRGNIKKASWTGCSTDANSGSGLDIDRTAGRELFNLTFVSCLFCRDGFGSMSAQGEYAGAKVRGTSGNTADFISFANCFVEAGLADDGGTVPAYTHPKYGIWIENANYPTWTGGRIDASVTAIYGGTSGWSSNYRPLLSIPERNVLTMPYWSDNASRPSPVIDGMFGINGTSNKVEFYWGGWHTVTST